MITRSAALISAVICLAASLTGPARAQRSSGTVLEEVVVTGSFIRRPSQFDSPSPLSTITSEDIDALGVNQISDVIDRLPINTGSQNYPDAFTQNFSTGTSNINLRGLGVSSTLVLINGRRETPSAVATDRGENFVDTSSLPPLIAFDRVEVLKDGATPLYGSEAVAGVANFITRGEFDGIDLAADLRTVDGYSQSEGQLSVLFGTGSETTHLLGAFSYLDRDPLSTNDRRLSLTTDDLSQAGNPGSFLIPSTPANPAYGRVWTALFDGNSNGVADALEPQLGLPPGAGARLPVFADPDCVAIAAQDPKVVPSIAVSVPTPVGAIPIGLCEFDFGDFYSIVPEERKISGYLEFTHGFAEHLRMRVELHAVDNEAERKNSPSFPFAAVPTIPATHPDNPYGTDVSFIGRVIGAGGTASPTEHDSTTWRYAGVLSGVVNAAWDWEAGVTASENDFSVRATDVLADRFGAAIRGFGGAGCDVTLGAPGVGACVYFNPFGSALTGAGTANSAALFDDLFGDFSYEANGRLTTIDGHVTGALGSLAGGPIGIALGAQLRREQISYDYDTNSNRGNFLFFAANADFAGDRNVEALFVELALPLGEALDLQVAGRYEDYGNSVDSADPKVTLLWRPTESLSLRASVGTSFRAPSLSQQFGVQTTLAELIDPSVGIPQFFPVRAQPNPKGEPLIPEQADVANLGFSWSLIDRLEFGIDYWSFAFDQVIVEQNPQAILNAAALGDSQASSQVVRAPTSGLPLRIDTYYANASSLDTDGFDFAVAYTLERGESSWRIGTDATLITRYDLVDPQAGPIDGRGRRNFGNFATSTPRLRANAFARWRHGRHGVDVFVRYIDRYLDDEIGLGQGPTDFRTIDSQTTVDAQYTLKLSRAFGPRISFGTINLFDADPPHVATNGGYDSKVHDPRGRLLFARASFEL